MSMDVVPVTIEGFLLTTLPISEPTISVTVDHN
jgi:hypothetical protein